MYTHTSAASGESGGTAEQPRNLAPTHQPQMVYCTVLYCTVLYCTVLCCAMLYHTTPYYSTSQAAEDRRPMTPQTDTLVQQIWYNKFTN